MKKNFGFTVLKRIVVLGILMSIVAAIAFTNRVGARVKTNESAAILTLRSIESAETLLQYSGKIDTDHDGIGEYGFYGELVGTENLRGTKKPVPFPPTFLKELSMEFRRVTSGYFERSGYRFKIFLPTSQGVPMYEGERDEHGVELTPGGDLSERFWCILASPIEPGKTGNRFFFLNNQSGNYNFIYAATEMPRYAEEGIDIAFYPPMNFLKLSLQ